MYVPAVRSLLAPERSTSDTVSEVVASQSRVRDWPAVALYPPVGTLKALSAARAAMA